MSRSVTCAYGNCDEWLEMGKGKKITVTKSNNGKVIDRQSFCSEEHAVEWLRQRILRQKATG